MGYGRVDSCGVRSVCSLAMRNGVLQCLPDCQTAPSIICSISTVYMVVVPGARFFRTIEVRSNTRHMSLFGDATPTYRRRSGRRGASANVLRDSVPFTIKLKSVDTRSLHAPAICGTFSLTSQLREGRLLHNDRSSPAMVSDTSAEDFTVHLIFSSGL